MTVFAIGNSSDAFLVLRATSDPIGMSFVTFLMVYVAFNMVQSAVSLRSGILSDTLGRKPLMVVGWLVFAVCYFGIARTTSASGIWLWFLIYGAHAGITEGVIRAYAVDLAPEHLRGTAIGAYYTFTGVAVLPASLIAGFLWDAFGPAAPFYYGAATSLAAVLILIVPLTKNR